ncbi:MAG: amidohydrolase [Tannerella sp.]|jgi:5-methylthioadenosine/S-adenosylhomocysteine deaminase|nr:amidohydrolase [Tannerella sp.]
MSIYIRNVLLDGELKNIYIDEDGIIKSVIHVGETYENRFEEIACSHDITLIDGTNKAVIPGLINMHTHAAMTLFRGYADDMPLKSWLEEKIWPLETKLTEEDVYQGTRLACLEMIKSGTTTFFDMYYHLDATAAAVAEMGLRAFLSEACFDFFRQDLMEKSKRRIEEGYKRFLSNADCQMKRTIRYASGPHAIYSVSGELLQWVFAFAKDNNIMIQMHLAETEQETANCVENFGLTPVRYLHRLGILSPNLVLAHVVHIDDEEIKILADAGVGVVHNPASNMKLASGYRFKFKEMKEAGIRVTLGTDGCASSNSLDMIEAMKLASLLGKAWRKDPEALACDEMLAAATKTAADILQTDTGIIMEGMRADLCLIDLCAPVFTPNHNFVSNLVYAANGNCVDTVVCDGRLLMQNRKVEGEGEILEHAARSARNLMGKR